MKIIFAMPHLRKLIFYHLYFKISEYQAESFPKNSSVTCLHMKKFGNDFRMFKIILEATQHIDCLELYRLTQEIFDLIPGACKSLKRLCLEIFEAKNVSNETFYLNLLELTCVYLEGSEEVFKKLNGKVVDYVKQSEYSCRNHRSFNGLFWSEFLNCSIKCRIYCHFMNMRLSWWRNK